MGLESIVEKILGYGAVGACCVIFIFLYLGERRELTTQSKDHVLSLTALQREVLAAVATLGELFESVNAKAKENERLQSEVNRLSIENQHLRSENAALRFEDPHPPPRRRLPTGGERT